MGKFPRALLILPLIWSTAASAAGPKITAVSLPQFRTLVKSCVQNVPDLKVLWEQEAIHHEPIYFSGGALRGLLRWMRDELAHGVAAHLLCRKVPPIEDLLILKNADRDLVDLASNRPLEVRNPTTALEYRDWDILPGDFHLASVEAGGSAIEKITVNPTEIDDPYGAIELFYKGQLKFVDTPERIFAKFRRKDSLLNSNSKTALVMRHLRMAEDLGVPLSKEELAQLKVIVADEYSAQKLPELNYWIKKSFLKLYQSTHENPVRMATILDSVGLRGPLEKLHYLNLIPALPAPGQKVAPKADHSPEALIARWIAHDQLDNLVFFAEMTDDPSFLERLAFQLGGQRPTEDLVDLVRYLLKKDRGTFASALADHVIGRPGWRDQMELIQDFLPIAREKAARSGFPEIYEKLAHHLANSASRANRKNYLGFIDAHLNTGFFPPHLLRWDLYPQEAASIIDRIPAGNYDSLNGVAYTLSARGTEFPPEAFRSLMRKVAVRQFPGVLIGLAKWATPKLWSTFPEERDAFLGMVRSLDVDMAAEVKKHLSPAMKARLRKDPACLAAALTKLAGAP